jgi:cytochrome c oxidase assembly factor 1
MGASMLGIIKYEDANSPVVSSTLYTLRRSSSARDALGQNITFASVMPWISGTIGAGIGVVDFRYRVKGDRAQGVVHFSARRDPKMHRFVVLDWSVTPDGGEKISLMDEDYHPIVPGPKEQPGRRLAKYNH